jgi:hypothetical protein
MNCAFFCLHRISTGRDEDAVLHRTLCGSTAPPHTREASSAAIGPRGAHSSGGRTPAATHQSASASLVLVVRTHPTQFGGGVAGLPHPVLDRAHLPLFQANAAVDSPKLRSPAAADRRTWLLILAYVHLRLAHDAVADVRLPWQPPLSSERRTPARVRRGFSHLLPRLGSPVNAQKPCGRSPGRPNGKRSPPAPRFPVVKLTP